MKKIQVSTIRYVILNKCVGRWIGSNANRIRTLASPVKVTEKFLTSIPYLLLATQL